MTVIIWHVMVSWPRNHRHLNLIVIYILYVHWNYYKHFSYKRKVAIEKKIPNFFLSNTYGNFFARPSMNISNTWQNHHKPKISKWRFSLVCGPSPRSNWDRRTVKDKDERFRRVFLAFFVPIPSRSRNFIFNTSIWKIQGQVDGSGCLLSFFITQRIQVDL